MIKILKVQRILTVLVLSFLTNACINNSKKEHSNSEVDKAYNNEYDSFKDVGQYWHLAMQIKPKKYWSITGLVPKLHKNELGHLELTKGIQYHLLCQSISGLVNRSVDQGKSDIGIWLYDHSEKETYIAAKQGLAKMGVQEYAQTTAIELVSETYTNVDGVKVQVKDLFNGYVLTDVENNPESNTVATVASHVHNAIIVDIRDKDYFDSLGFKMKYDASKKHTQDAWNEFKDKCNNNALVVMPLQTAEQREFAIKNNLFVINLNKQYNDASAGQNIALFEEVLQWLEPGAPVYGWEQGVGEHLFVDKISEAGNIMIPADWMYNLNLTSILYKNRQKGLAKILDPRTIDFKEIDKNYVSYHLSDGDNVQWMMNAFGGKQYYTHPEANTMKVAFGLPVDNLSMMAPDVLNYLFEKQAKNTSIVQTFGGGYNYADSFGLNRNRTESLKKLASSTAMHMRQHRVKVLSLMAKDVGSAKAKEAYKAYIKANNQLEGIIAVQYSPYAGGKGEIYWVTNTDGYDIPIVTVKYSLWNFGNVNKDYEGTPTYIANKLNSQVSTDTSNLFNLISIHAWSRFSKARVGNSELVENKLGPIIGPGVAKLNAAKLSSNFKLVNVEELIWRIRMHYKPKQTEKRLVLLNRK
ncbi:GxGYxYP domain-containing protein [Algibacter pectinivorans]|uniref:GxGYxY sequence motif-containing protein n=1 Tax=Algibacter pectinivorans TaxID=870482 RepID=A0A1I1M9R9_9FLAO|nr:GxGYxYP domain-containing protein [Algibacter pectinivorans]SFC79948.1 GxGYxY sequence motif-containing protein [Algibacter pectinivorans]